MKRMKNHEKSMRDAFESNPKREERRFSKRKRPGLDDPPLEADDGELRRKVQ